MKPQILVIAILNLVFFFSKDMRGQINAIPDYTIVNDQEGTYLGISVEWAGDLNGDGFEDMVAGSHTYHVDNYQEGAAFVYYGSATGLEIEVPQVLHTTGPLTQFGRSVSPAGDVNGDGYDDIVVGAPYFEDGALDTDEGRAYFYYGSPTGVSNVPSAIADPNQNYALLGYTVAGGGDINADGYDDVLVTAINYDDGQTNEGRVYIYFGSASGIQLATPSTLEGDQNGAGFGSSCAIAGDLNSDGYDDIIIGAPSKENGQTDEGICYIYHGFAGGISLTPATVIESNKLFASFANSVSSAGDVNGDGYDDVAIGSYKYRNILSNEGAAFIYYGSAAGINTLSFDAVYGNQSGCYLGAEVAFAGDMNNDGYSDVLIAATDYTNLLSGEGRTYLYLGSATGLVDAPSVFLEGDQAEALFGFALSGGSDYNNDGYDDVIISSDLFDTEELDDVGAVYVYNGSNCTPQYFYADVDGDGFGNPLSYILACNAGSGYVTDSLDCNDANAFQNPLSVWYIDADGDKYYAGTGGPVNQCLSPGITYSCEGMIGTNDCDDLNELMNPTYVETLDGFDNDCNGMADEGFLQTFDVLIEGNLGGVLLGYDVSDAGDVNNDGYADIIAGAPYYTSGELQEGIAYVYKGGPDGVNVTPILSYQNHQASSHLGKSVSFAGDVNGDGFDDVVFGAPDYDALGGISDAGRVYIFHGKSTGLNETPTKTLTGTVGSRHFGWAVTGIGDVNNDGYDDIAVSDEGGSSEQIFIYHGSASGISSTPALTIPIPSPTVFYLPVVDAAGDINGDGYDDVLMGAVQWFGDVINHGAVLIFFGSSGGLNTSPDMVIEGNMGMHYFGMDVAGNGDVNADGFKDIVVRTSDFDMPEDDLSLYLVYYGDSTGILITPDTIFGTPGVTSTWLQVDFAGDINGDSFDDIVVGSATEEEAGNAYFYYGSTDGIITSPAFMIRGSTRSSQFGYCISTAGDINGDDISDFLISDLGYTNDKAEEGAVFIYMGGCTMTAFYEDNDSDGYGDPGSFVTACSVPPGYVADNSDCNDANELIFPGSTEICNTFDDDCDVLVDEDLTPSISIAAGGVITFCQGGSVLLTATHSGTTLQWKKDGVNIPGATNTTYTVTKKATYTCTTTSACGSTTSTGILVNVQKNPPANITAGGPTSFCMGGSVVLTANAGAGLSYQWYKGATPLAGATLISYTATLPGNYKCRVTKTVSGCFKNSNAIIVTVPCKQGETTSHSSLSTLTFTLHPNPTTDKLTITIHSLFTPHSSLLITDLSGKTIEQHFITSSTTELDVSNYAAGMYLVTIEIAGEEQIQKFIKQ